MYRYRVFTPSVSEKGNVMTHVASIKIQRTPFSVRYRLAESLTWSKREMKAYLYKKMLNKNTARVGVWLWAYL